MKKLILLMPVLLLTGCNVYLVQVDKSVCVHGESNTTSMSGSELKDISSDPATDVSPTTDVTAVP